jgi:hypothetical protein
LGKVFGKKRDTGPNYETIAAEGEKVTDFENEWLKKMIDADGEADELESLLVARLAYED